MKAITIIFASLVLLTLHIKAQTVNDVDGNVYDTVHIGTQVWLQQNLATTKYNDGTAIPLVTDNTWYSLTTPAYCWYNNDSITYKSISGALYNWYTVNTGKLCPKGWHVPTDVEWTTLVKNLDPSAGANDCYCNQSATAGDELKQVGTSIWGKGNNGTNSSGFTAVGGGFRNYACDCYSGHPAVAYFWTATQKASYPTVYNYYLMNSTSIVYDNLDYPYQGMSVRCIQDTQTTGTTGLNTVKNTQLLTIYPNPATEKIKVVYNTNQPAELFIYNQLGKTVIYVQLHGNTYEIDVHSLPAGIYIVTVVNSQGSIQQKLVKE